MKEKPKNVFEVPFIEKWELCIPASPRRIQSSWPSVIKMEEVRICYKITPKQVIAISTAMTGKTRLNTLHLLKTVVNVWPFHRPRMWLFLMVYF